MVPTMTPRIRHLRRYSESLTNAPNRPPVVSS